MHHTEGGVSRIEHFLATDAQRSYLTRLCNAAFAKRVDPGPWAGRDSRAAIRSEYLLKADASAWIEHLKSKLSSAAERRTA